VLGLLTRRGGEQAAGAGGGDDGGGGAVLDGAAGVGPLGLAQDLDAVAEVVGKSVEAQQGCVADAGEGLLAEQSGLAYFGLDDGICVGHAFIFSGKSVPGVSPFSRCSFLLSTWPACALRARAGMCDSLLV
jgi:hypothetical protein